MNLTLFAAYVSEGQARQVLQMLIWLVLCGCVTCPAQSAAMRLAPPQQSSTAAPSVEQQRLQLERERLDFDKAKSAQELDQKKQDSRNERLKAYISAASTGVPLLVQSLGFGSKADGVGLTKSLAVNPSKKARTFSLSSRPLKLP